MIDYKKDFERQAVEIEMKKNNLDYRKARSAFLKWKKKNLGEYNKQFKAYFDSVYVEK